jgi:tRNA/tmRNA/rRNA uracil-C5-methylase (TrmA/RlmC/RlmD family)
MFDKVIGVDIVKSSIDDAMGNAAANNMSDKSEFHCGKAEDIVKKLFEKNSSEKSSEKIF